jgi:hypothetical protein
MAAHPAKKRKMACRYAADDAPVRQRREGSTWENDLGILTRNPADAGV